MFLLLQTNSCPHQDRSDIYMGNRLHPDIFSLYQFPLSTPSLSIPILSTKRNGNWQTGNWQCERWQSTLQNWWV